MEKCESCPLKNKEQKCYCQVREVPIYCKFMSGPEKNDKYIPIVLEMSNAPPQEIPLRKDDEGVSPSLWNSAKNLVKTAVDVTTNYVKTGELFVPDEEYQRRLSICKSCPKYLPTEDKCKICTCFMPYKCHLAAVRCADEENVRWLEWKANEPPIKQEGCSCGR